MEHLKEFQDLEWLIKEVHLALGNSWSFFRLLRPWSLSAQVYSAKTRYPFFQDFKAFIPKNCRTLDELRVNSTLAYQRELVPELPIGNPGRVVACLAFIAALADYWLKLPGPKPSTKQVVRLLVVPYWQKICNALAKPKAQELERMREFRQGIYKELGMQGSVRLRESVLAEEPEEGFSGSEMTLVATRRIDSSTSESEDSSEEQKEVWSVRV